MNNVDYEQLISRIENKQDAEEVKNLVDIVQTWQKWWNTFGSEWYYRHGFPQQQKPDFLKANSTYYNKWIH